MNRQDRNKATVARMFESPPEFDRLTLFADDVEWWNGIGKFPSAPGQTVFRGKKEIGDIILGRAPAPKPKTGRRVDRYNTATKQYRDVLTIADGDYVFRQHEYAATTVRGRQYSNSYGFLFRFDAAGLIDRIWEHWGTLAAWDQLFAGDLVVTDPDELLMTTPSVRKRLDLTRPVEREVVQKCLDLAVHAPNGSNQQSYRFVCVDDAATKTKLAEIYRMALDDFTSRPRTAAAEDNVDRTTPAARRVTESVMYLNQHLHEVPVLCIPMVAGRTDGNGEGPMAERTNAFWQASRWGSVIPMVWSFMLALRSRGLGSAWTTLTLLREREVADVLGVPYQRWMQAGLFPVAHTLGTDFKPTPRRPAAEFMRWNSFRGD